MRKKNDVSAQLVEIIEDSDSNDSSSPGCSSVSKSKPAKTIKRDGPGKRLHNESEKTRRNRIKSDFEKLKAMVPTDEGFEKQTTVSLLHKAKSLILSLEAKEKKQVQFKTCLTKEQQYLKRRLEQLTHLVNGGAIGLGNTLLLSASRSAPPPKAVQSKSTQPQIAPVIHANSSQEMTTAGSRPHILKRKQVLLSSPVEEPQIVVADLENAQVLNPENVCLIIDEMEYLEGVPYYGWETLLPGEQQYSEEIRLTSTDL